MTGQHHTQNPTRVVMPAEHTRAVFGLHRIRGFLGSPISAALIVVLSVMCRTRNTRGNATRPVRLACPLGARWWTGERFTR